MDVTYMIFKLPKTLMTAHFTAARKAESSTPVKFTKVRTDTGTDI